MASLDFGQDLGSSAAEQVALGLEPAIWIAPLYVLVEAPMVGEHPEWFVHDSQGQLRTFSNFGPTYAALDAVFGWGSEGYQIEIELPANAQELLPPTGGGQSVTSRPVTGRTTVDVPAHGVRLFAW